MKNHLLVILWFASSLLLLGCGQLLNNKISNNTSTSQSKDVVHLKMIGHWLNEGKREKLIREFVNEFEFENQDISVNMQFPEDLYNGDYGELDFIVSQVTKPVSDFDIIRIKTHYPEIAAKFHDQYWGAKYLVDFSTIPGFVDSHVASLDLEKIKSRTGNICVGPYMEGNYEVIYVNLDLAKKIGISVKQFGMTFDDFLSYIRVVDVYNKTNNTSLMAIFENADHGWITTETIFLRLCYSLLDDFKEISENRITEKKFMALEKTYQAYEALSKYHPIRDNKYRKEINWTRDNDYPLKDSCLFFVNGSYMYNIWDGKNHVALSKIMPCELPVFKPTDTYLGDYSSTWCVPKNAPHREAAIRMMMYWCRPAMAEKWVRYTKCPAGIKGSLAEISFGIDPYEDFQYQMNKKYGKNLVAAGDYVQIFGNNIISLNSSLVLGGEITAADAIHELRKGRKK